MAGVDGFDFLVEKCKKYWKNNSILEREDGKIDVSLYPAEGKRVQEATDKILSMFKDLGGTLPFNDKTSPEDIKKHFQMSKKVFKKAIGVLYKQRIIRITDKGIEFVAKKSNY